MSWITFYEAIMRKRWAELEIHRAESVWKSAQQTFLAQVVGPHFEALCRDFALDAGTELFGASPAEIGSGAISDPESRIQIEIDVAVLAAQESNQPRQVLSLGEAKSGEVMGHHHLARLIRARELLALKGYDTAETILTCYSGAGFTKELTVIAAEDDNVLLVDLDRLYQD